MLDSDKPETCGLALIVDSPIPQRSSQALRDSVVVLKALVLQLRAI